MTTIIAVNGKEFYMKNLPWRILSDFILYECRDVIRQDEKQNWQENCGKIISDETAKAIAGKLEELIEKGIVERFKVELEIGNLGHHFTDENLKKFIQFIKHSAGFDIW